MIMDIKSQIEAVLLAYGEPMPIAKLAKVLGEKEDRIARFVDKLQTDYLEQQRGFAIIQKDDSIQLVSHPDCADIIRRLKRVEDEITLSPATLEVLSIISYRAPITRMEIEMIRGVNCSSILRALSIRGLIERTGQEGNNRSYEYTPSFALFRILGINTIRDLPDYESLSKDKKLYPTGKEYVSA